MPPLAVEGMRQEIRERVRSMKVGRKTSLVRLILADIDVAREAGFTYVQIAGWLAEKGYLNISGKHLAVIACQLHKHKKGRPKPKAQLDMFDQFRGNKPVEDGKKFRHDPTADGKALM